MISIYAPFELEMEISHLDDKMELGTSPYPQIDDIDFDFEPQRQQSVDRSMVDETEMATNNTDAMQSDQDNVFDDDDMHDDETLHPSYENNIEDLNMESYNEDENHPIDEEILYDDEDGGFIDVTEQQQEEGGEEIVAQTGPVAEVEDNAETQEETGLFSHSNTNTTINTTDLTSNIENETTENTQEVPGMASPHAESGETEVIDFASHGVTDQQDEEAGHNESDDEVDAIKSAFTTQSVEYETNNTNVHDDQPSETATQEDLAQSTSNATAEPIETNAPSAENGHTSNDQEALHPITVVYLGQEMSFFPPMAEDTSATFFLADSNLAYEPLEKLLMSCRDILGETLEHDDELVLDIPTLGLHICEDSKYASQISLSQVVDVYLSLSRNQHLDIIEPLYCDLSSRVCLASQYAYLNACAAEGKTYSEIAADYADSPDHDTPAYTENVETGEQGEDRSVTDPIPEGESTDSANQDVVYGVEHTESGPSVQPDDAVTLTTDPTAPRLAESQKHEQTIVEPEDHISEARPGQASSIPPSPERHSNNSEQAIELLNEPDSNYDTNDTNVEDINHETGGIPESEVHSSSTSHTVEGEVAPETEQPTSELDQNDKDDAGATFQEQQHAHDEDLDAYDLAEDLFKDEPEDSKSTLSDPETSAAPDPQPAKATVNGNGDAKPSSHPADDTAQDELGFDEFETELTDEGDTIDNEDDYDLLQAADESVPDPVTPSKQNGNKRKILEEEDELDFLDISTPEPKRTRAS